MNQERLLAMAAFTPDLLDSPSGWLGHLPFAAWVIGEVSPATLVELGAHYGHSFFAFCQAIIEAGIPTRCVAVDTWRGDEHAGYYGDEIFTKVHAYQREHYSGFSRLLRMNFDQAVAGFPARSIGLLHIDGMHSYDAVRHDFETWLPKLAPGAIVMFHDTAVRERNFGVWKFWEELQAVYPNNLEFEHSHGLGVLQLNDAPDGKLLDWLRPGAPEKQHLKNYFAALGSRQQERFELCERRRHALADENSHAEHERRGRGAPSLFGHYRLGDGIDFHLGGNALLFQQSGWDVPTAGGTWTIEHKASLGFRIVDWQCGSMPLWVEIEAQGLIAARHQETQMELYINGDLVGRGVFGEAMLQHWCYSVPSGAMPELELFIEFLTLNPASPKALGLSEDDRELGLLFTNMRITQR